MAHLVTTFSLLAVLTLTAWFAGGGKTFNFQVSRKVLILLSIAVAGIFLIGMSGSIAALSTMLLPKGTLSEEFAKDFAETSHILQRLRISHPILSISVGVYLVFLAGWLKSQALENARVSRWADILCILVLIQFASGAITLFTHAPILMQITHLLLADLLWIAFILLFANVLTEHSAGEKSLSVSELRSAIN
jgi:heme A synthase